VNNLIMSQVKNFPTVVLK